MVQFVVRVERTCPVEAEEIGDIEEEPPPPLMPLWFAMLDGDGGGGGGGGGGDDDEDVSTSRVGYTDVPVPIACPIPTCAIET